MKKIPQLFSLNNKTCLITGAAGHLGKVFAQTLAELGANLILVDLDLLKLNEIAEDLSSQFPNVSLSIIHCDLESSLSRTELIGKIQTDHKFIDVMINNAAIVSSDSLPNWTSNWPDQSLQSWNRGIEVNLTAAFDLVRGLTPLLLKSEGASIINIGSLYGLWGPDWKLYENLNMGNSAAYAASKAALIQLTRWWATTLAPSVRSNSIVPGGIYRNHDPIFVSRFCERTPLARMATEQDFVGIIAFLATDASSYVTGQTISIDGGWSAW